MIRKTPLFSFVFLLVAGLTAYAQTPLPFTFETTPDSADFVNFDGGTGSVVDNPIVNDNNPSSRVGQIVRDGGEIWAGSKILLPEPLDLANLGGFRMKVLSPIGGIIAKLKLEGPGAAIEQDMVVQNPSEWTELEYNFAGQPSGVFNEVVFMFDFGNLGNGTDFSTFYFDDVENFDWTGGLDPIDLPITFESPDVFYGMSDFGGNTSELTEWPTGGHVMKVIKPDGAATWSGTTMSMPDGLASAIPLQPQASKIYVHTYSPVAGLPIRLKAEDAQDPTHSVETDAFSTVANAWEILEFDFNNESIGTAVLNPDFTFNMLSIFFNFGTEGSEVGEQVYYFDNVSFMEPIASDVVEFGTRALALQATPNPTRGAWVLSSQLPIEQWTLHDAFGKLVQSERQMAQHLFEVDSNHLNPGVYVWTGRTARGLTASIRLVKLN
ncbi:MAG: T9SS type A sorting domain-containing protein [Flavobacteriales bacterium]